jgi:signal transduction histidine kinase
MKDSCDFIRNILDSFFNDNSILDFHPENIILHPVHFDLIELFDKIYHLSFIPSSQKNIVLKALVKKNIVTELIGDENKLQHVLMNLLSNSIKFSKNDATIHLICKGKICDNKQHIVIEVIDENDKIPTNIKKKLFEKFNTGDSANGTGLGLYISKKIIEKHGGTITYKRKQNQNIFTISLSLEMSYLNKNRDSLLLYKKTLFPNKTTYEKVSNEKDYENRSHTNESKTIWL